MRNMSFLQFCGLMVTLITGVYTCGFAAEGEPHEIRYTAPSLPEGVQKVFWFKEDHLIAECSIGSKICVVIDLRLRQAKIERTENGIAFSAEVANVSRQHSNNAEGNWILKNDFISHGSQTVYSCLLGVYSKPDQVYCDAKWTTDELTISCKTNRIYPEAMMKVDIKNKTSTIISCENTRISTEPYYYRAECIFIIPTKDFHFKKNEIDIYIYPNIIGFYNSIGVNVSIDITIENPTVHGNICVDKDQYVACRCIKLHWIQDVKSVEWLLNNTTVGYKGSQANFTKEQPEMNDLGYNLITCEIRWENNHDHYYLVYVVTALAVLVSLLTATLLFFIWRIRVTNDGVYHKSETKHSTTYSIDETTTFICSKSDNSNGELDVTDNIQNSRKNFDINIMDEKSILLLLRTRNTHEVDISKTVFQSNIKRLDANNKTIQLDYFQFKDRIFKVVNVPEYDAKDKTEFREMLNNSICLSPEGYSAFIVIFNAEEYKDANGIIYMLVDAFGKDVLNYLIVFLSNERQEKVYQEEIKTLNELCNERCFVCDTISDVCNIIHTFVVDMNYLYVNNYFKMRFDKSQSHTDILMENLIQDICLLFSSTKSVEKRDEKKDCLLQNWANLKNKINPSTYRFDDIQYLMDLFIIEKYEAGSTQTNSQQISEDFEKCLESVKYDYINQLISERTQFLGNIFNLDEIYLTCLHGKRKKLSFI